MVTTEDALPALDLPAELSPLVTNWVSLLQLFPADLDLERSARDHKAFQRPREIRTAADLLRLALVYSVADFSLRQTAAWSEATDTASVSDVALLGRFSQMGPWLAHLVGRLLIAPLPLPPGQRRIKLIDATSFSIPGSDKAEWRIHAAMDLGNLSTLELRLTTAKTGEHLSNSSFSAGELVVADRGHAQRAGIGRVVEAGADLLLRVPWRTFPLQTREGQDWDWWAAFRSLSPGECGDFLVQTRPEADRGWAAIPGRLLVIPLPPAAAARARKRARQNAKKRGKELSPEAWEAAGYLYLFTTVSQAEANAASLLALYRFRWQIELLFKRLKSIVKIDEVRAQKPELVQTYLYGKLLGVVLLEKYSQRWLAFSPWSGALTVAPPAGPVGEPPPHRARAAYPGDVA